ncbi:MAG TPA: universal stress protein [Polyangiaceae bacterium]|jgi:nucleotide-binding universal stress UspA family protein
MRILVASDLSSASDEAVRQGLSLATASGSALALCHVLHRSSVNALFPQGYARDLEMALELQPRVAELLREQAERVQQGPTISFEVFVEQGSDYGQIARRAEKWRADLLVVGSHGRTGVERLLLGSVAEHLVRHAPCTVLVAREDHEGAVLVATDLSDPSLVGIEVAAREAARRGRKLVVVHVLDDAALESDAAMAMLGTIPVAAPMDLLASRRTLARDIIQNALMRFDAPRSQIEIPDGDPVTEILRVAETLPAELVVIGTKGESGLSHVLGSTAADVVQNAPCSVLAVRVV